MVQGPKGQKKTKHKLKDSSIMVSIGLDLF